MKTSRAFVAMIALAALCGLCGTSAQAQVDQKQAKEDWKALDALCVTYQRVYMSESEVMKKGAAFHDEWQEWKKQFVPLCDAWKKRYGDQVPAVTAAFEGISKPLDVQNDAWMCANIAYNLDVAQQEQQYAEWAEKWGKDKYRVATHMPDTPEKAELRFKRAEEAVAFFKLAKLWKPDGDYADSIAAAEKVVAEARPAWKKALAELKWPGHNKDFAGPGNPDELAKAALEFLRKNPTWSKPEYEDEHTPLAACVTGSGWEVWKKAPVTGEPTQFSIELQVAFTGAQDPELVYVYHMVFYTAEEAGVQKGLPFKFANSKQYASFRLLKANVPAE